MIEIYENNKSGEKSVFLFTAHISPAVVLFFMAHSFKLLLFPDGFNIERNKIHPL